MAVYSPKGGNQTEIFPPGPFDENCLTLNMWAPPPPEKELPVFLWYFGGGFKEGGTSALYYNPQSWVQRTQEHIVVTVNFRSNIFGYPNPAGLTEQNLGLLDQRMGLEWVRDNIANFGGDPAKIVTWGESAGAVASDYLNFAYPSDPIASGMILDSGTALFSQECVQSADVAQANFTAVAVALGCEVEASQVDCLRTASWQAIESILALDKTLKFLTVVDNRAVFSNYTKRYEMGALSPIPAIVGSNEHEFNEAYPLSLTYNQTTADRFTNAFFLCTAAMTSQLRQSASLITYQFRHDGNFSDISPPGYPGAYHASELPLLFGTIGLYHGPATAYEKIVSRQMQDLWLGFAKDPKHGLGKAGWNPYGNGNGTSGVILGGMSTPVHSIGISELDGVCTSIDRLYACL